ncbi:hypothetical protein BDV96DRAFT_564303 [Lophiotrema nucula]|uniref:Uncharacterized protein n=1 Tax=Lophiotrema nucula TaxID=690887 RepID=A0A6A5ZQP5_9PLEO|nr:hypothetical protein BDV96DRAFT_564303 [Lophiotrema nucula]
MLLQGITALLALNFLPSLTTAIPLVPALLAPQAAGSSHNIYLVTCTPKKKKSDSDNGGNKDSTPKSNFTAIAYFKGPIANATQDDGGDDDGGKVKLPKADKAAEVSEPPSAWEGVKYVVKVWRDKLFSASINAEAAAGTNGSLSGSVKLGDEDYVCFRDGTTALRVKEDELRGNCVADYWCAGLGNGDSGKGDGL